MQLSKSQYCSAVQCPKMLWLKKNQPDLLDDSGTNQAVLSAGIEVGKLTRGIFGEYTNVTFNSNQGELLRDTARLIDDNTPVITEATFSWNGLICRVDILKNLGHRIVEIYEVKSSTDIKDIYVDDLSFQRYILTELGYRVTKACVVYINNKYVRQGQIDLEQLFVIRDMTEEVEAAHDDVEHFIDWLKKYMSNESEPSDEIGMHCFTPYECDFFAYCTRKLPQSNVFNLARVKKSKMFQCYRDGLVSFSDLYRAGIFSSGQALQIEHELSTLPPHIEKSPIRDFVDSLSYPLYFLDFESFNPAIPLYDNSHPYEQIVFQYSLHIMEAEGGDLQHREFLAYPGKDPRRELAENLCKDIPLNACTVAYNMTFEKTRLKELASLFPDLSDHLMNIFSHMRDLMIPFQKKQYYVKAMEGSYSIKYVLPALFPNDPTLDYHNLEGVHNGSEASATFQRMAEMDKKELDEYRGHLLKYCGLDTFAMVKIWEKLREVSS